MSNYIQVLTTLPTQAQAQHIAEAIVRQRLAACAQILGPITSTYWWKGQVEKTEEWLCLLKTRQEHYTQLEAALRQLHPYEVPEIIALPILAGFPPYLTWLQEETDLNQET